MSTQRVAGIYQIRNTVNGKVYVGSALNVQQRWWDHRKYLKKGTHHSQHLQHAWDKYGAPAFSFEVIELARQEELIIREQFYIDSFSVVGLYNTNPRAGSSLGMKHSEQARVKMSAAQKLRAPPSVETRAKIGAKSRGNTHALGHKHTEEFRAKRRAPLCAETCAKMSAARKGQPLSEAHRANISAGRKGMAFSEKHRSNLSAAHKGIRLSEHARAKVSAAVKAYHARKAVTQCRYPS